jgi:hypothetical protein
VEIFAAQGASPVSFTPVANGLGEDDSRKKILAKNLVTLPLSQLKMTLTGQSHFMLIF